MAARDAKGRGGGGRGGATGRQQGGGGGRQTSGGSSSSMQGRAGAQGRGGAAIGGAGGGRSAQGGGGGRTGGGQASRGAQASREARGGGSAGGASPRSASGGAASVDRAATARGVPVGGTRGASAGVSSGGARGASTGGVTAPDQPTGGTSSVGGGARKDAAHSADASRPSAADVDSGLGTIGTSGAAAAGVSGGPASAGPEQHRDLETVREGRTSTGAAQAGRSVGAQRTAGAQAAGGVSREAQGRQGLSPWFAGADNPLAMMRRMQEDLDRVFHAFGIPRVAANLVPGRELEELLSRSPAFTQAAQWSPQIEVFERDDALVVRADLPGVKRDDVEVNVENDVLTIRGQRRQQHREVDGGYRRTERSYGTFFRQIPLPDGVEPSQIEAAYEDGVLEVTIPSPREQLRGRRRIEIR